MPRESDPHSAARPLQLGFVGLGRMGLPMCANLVAAGYQVQATDARTDLQSAATEAGVVWRPTAAGVAAGADVLITMLPGADEVTDVMLGSGRVVDSMAAGSAWIDMSCSSPTAAQPVRDRAVGCGLQVLDAPVGGGVRAARDGTLQLFVGGDAEVLTRVRPVLEAVADPGRILHMGAAGAGYTTKLLVNLLWFGQAVATAEALLLGQRTGIDVAAMRRALEGSAAASEFIRHDLDALLHGDYLTSFGLDGICAELDAVARLADDYEVPFELSGAVRHIYHRALARFGSADGELLAVALLEEQAGMLLRDCSEDG